VGRLEVVGDTLVLVVAAAHGPARYELVVPNRQFRAELQAAAGTTVTLVAEPIADVKGRKDLLLPLDLLPAERDQ
jgi:hypothetical protein